MPPTTRRSPAPEPTRVAASEAAPAKRRESNRDTIESIVIAFILALLIRGFAAEAFVIPTGSMAPTLMGRHMEITCPQCGNVFRVNASDEAERKVRYSYATCENCRFAPEVTEDARFNGDRILVSKLPYSMPWLPGASGPERWDVVVFHYPVTPEQNFIKRLAGLPNEDLLIHAGDLFTRPIGSSEPYRIQRKPPRHQNAMLQLVYDDRHRPTLFADRADWRRWKPSEAGGWSEAEPGQFRVQADGSTTAWLRYMNLLPSPDAWTAVARGEDPGPPQAEPVTDYYSYNSNRTDERESPPSRNWVGDLSVAFNLQVEQARGQFEIELIEAGIPHRCTIDLATGQATLSRAGRPVGEPRPTPLSTPGAHSIAFANIDDRLTLTVDGDLPFGDGVDYEVARPWLESPESLTNGPSPGPGGIPVPTSADVAPVALGASAEAAVAVTDLVLHRDIFYTLPSNRRGGGRGWPEQPQDSGPARSFPELVDSGIGRFLVRPGRYLMLGDNSPRSLDAREWSGRDTDPNYGWAPPDSRDPHEVPEELLIGKAFFVYWPHGKPIWPAVRVRGELRLPFRPYVERMRWIR